VLRTKSGRSSALRLLDDRDLDEVLALCDRDPVVNVFVSSRVHEAGLDLTRLGGQVWGYQPGAQLVSLCYLGANLVPVAATPEAVSAFAGRARMMGRRCSSIVGPAAAVVALWDLLRPSWGPAREVRAVQPMLEISAPPQVPPDPLVRPVRRNELDILLPASVAMFTEEVGVSPTAGDGGASYRARLEQLIRSGRAFARISGGRVIFKAEIGAVSATACQIQGVWVAPSHRGRGIGAAGTAAVVEYARTTIAPVVSLYVNDFNGPARAAYARVGFREVGRFASVLF
jgi:predicted GNAT family acetyltransferase